MKVLLHICCAPCVVYPLRELSKDGRNSVTGFFYNPNIHPYAEMERRRQAVTKYSIDQGLDVIFGEYEIEDFFKNIGSETEGRPRCNACWRMRLSKTAHYARENDFGAFTTTLLVSPYQDREAILKIGNELSKDASIKFIDGDFRSGFREAQQFAREHKIYMQKYCGCVFSEKERFCKKR